MYLVFLFLFVFDLFTRMRNEASFAFCSPNSHVLLSSLRTCDHWEHELYRSTSTKFYLWNLHFFVVVLSLSYTRVKNLLNRPEHNMWARGSYRWNAFYPLEMLGVLPRLHKLFIWFETVIYAVITVGYSLTLRQGVGRAIRSNVECYPWSASYRGTSLVST